MTTGHFENPSRARTRRRAAVIASAVWFLTLAIFAVATRRPMLREGLWRDEAISVSIATAPSVSQLLERNRVSDYNPPLFNLLLAGYTRIFGSGELPLKIFALALGLLAVAGATALAWELGGPVAAALAAAFVVHNPLLIEMSTEIRAYSLSAFLTAICLFSVFRIRRSAGAGRAAFVGLWALLALLVYSHVAGGVVTAVLFAWGLFEWRREPALPFGRRLALTAFAAGGTYLFWIRTTWRQFRAGIPWETPLTPAERLESLLRRSADILPIPQAFGQPWFLIAMAALLGVVVLLASAVFARFRGRWEALVVPALAAAAVWLPLGLFSQHSRYLIIPATLVAVVFSVAVSRVAEAAGDASRPFRVASWVALAALIVASFSARRDFYEARWSLAERPKSGIRTLCRSRSFGPDELVVIVPDYLAPTAWYYCGRAETLHGFARWNRPDLFDPVDHGAQWRDPAAPGRVVSEIEARLRDGKRSRFTLLRELAPAGFLPFYESQAALAEGEISRRFERRSVSRFPGRIEPVEALVLEAR
ncbi:MAG: glycosyltransferase family 39 protein [Thermoanaerobaculia bacterium]